MNDVFKSMPPAAKPNGIGGRTESKQNSLDGETYKAIQTAKKTSLGDPEESKYCTCFQTRCASNESEPHDNAYVPIVDRQ